MPKRARDTQGMSPVYIIDEPENKTEGEQVYEVILGMAGATLNGVELPITTAVGGSFATLSANIPNEEIFVVLTLQTPSTVVWCGEHRLGIITDDVEYLVVWEDATKQRRRVSKNGFPQHARLLIACYLFWRHLVRYQLIEIEAFTH